MAERKEAGVGVGSQAFQPGQSEAMADWTNASKGQTPDQSLAIGIEAAGTAFKQGITAKYNYITDTISQKATEAVDAVQNMHLGYEDDIARRAGNTQELTDAYRAGAISPSYYWMHMDQASRALRAQYPNFRDNIDQEFSKRTGGTPANKIIQELQANASARTQSEEQKFQKTVERWGTSGLLPPDFDLRAARGQSYSREELTAYVFNKQSNEMQLKAAKADLETRKANREEYGAKSYQVAQGEANGFINDTFNSVTSIAGKDYRQAMATLRPYQASGTTPPPKEFQEIMGQLLPLQDKAKIELQNRINGYPGLSREDKKALLEDGNARIDTYFNPIRDKQFGITGYQAATNEYAKNSRDGQLLSDPAIATLTSFKTLVGPDVTNAWLNQNPEAFGASQTALNRHWGMAIGTGQVSVTGALAELDKVNADSATKRATINGAINMMSMEEMPQQVKANVAMGLFGKDNQELLNTVNPKDRASLYATLTNDKVATEMKKQKAMGNDKVFNEYVDWVEQSFLALNQQHANTMNQARSRKDFDVEYSPILKQFVQKTVPGGPSLGDGMNGAQRVVSNLLEKKSKSDAKAAMSDVNTALAGLSSAYKAMGMSDEEINKSFAEIYEAFGSPASGERGEPAQNTLFNYLSAAVRGTIPDDKPKGKSTKNGSEQQISDSQIQPTPLSPLATQAEEVGIVGLNPDDSLAATDITPAAPLNDVQPTDRTLVTQYRGDVITDQAIVNGLNGGTAQRTVPFQGEPGDVGAEEVDQSQGVPLTSQTTRGQSAAIRSNNPGAQWPGPISSRFGSTRSETLRDGNKIAIFDNPVDGAAAQFALLSESDHYKNKTLRQAISTWSGGNNVNGYVKLIESRTGVGPNTKLTPELMADPRFAIPLAKAMARQEGGKEYPLTDAQWAEAHYKAHPLQVAESRVNSNADTRVRGTAAGVIPRFNALKLDDLSSINEAVISTENLKNADERDAYNREMKGEYFGIYNMRRQALAYHVMNLPNVEPEVRAEAKQLFESLISILNKDIKKYEKNRTPGDPYYESGRNSVGNDIREQLQGEDSIAALRKILNNKR